MKTFKICYFSVAVLSAALLLESFLPAQLF